MDTTIPSVLITGDLTLEEIGAVFVAFSFPNVEEHIKRRWVSDDNLNDVFKRLQEKGMLRVENNKLQIDIIDPNKEDFFLLEDYDKQNNPIYISPARINDDGEMLVWRVKPALVSMNIVWLNCSDKSLLNEDTQMVFDSLEESEEYFETLNNEYEC
jgi:hypothetical protein